MQRIMSLFQCDLYRGRRQADYLRRSAVLIRSSVGDQHVVSRGGIFCFNWRLLRGTRLRTATCQVLGVGASILTTRDTSTGTFAIAPPLTRTPLTPCQCRWIGSRGRRISCRVFLVPCDIWEQVRLGLVPWLVPLACSLGSPPVLPVPSVPPVPTLPRSPPSSSLGSSLVSPGFTWFSPSSQFPPIPPLFPPLFPPWFPQFPSVSIGFPVPRSPGSPGSADHPLWGNQPHHPFCNIFTLGVLFSCIDFISHTNMAS